MQNRNKIFCFVFVVQNVLTVLYWYSGNHFVGLYTSTSCFPVVSWMCVEANGDDIRWYKGHMNMYTLHVMLMLASPIQLKICRQNLTQPCDVLRLLKETLTGLCMQPPPAQNQGRETSKWHFEWPFHIDYGTIKGLGDQPPNNDLCWYCTEQVWYCL